MTYFFISTDEDGDHYIEALTKEEALNRVYELSESYALDEEDLRFEERFEERLPEGRDMKYWHPTYLIIKGEIVVPEAREVKTVYELK